MRLLEKVKALEFSFGSSDFGFVCGSDLEDQINGLPDGKKGYYLNLCYISEKLTEQQILEFFEPIPVKRVFMNMRKEYITFDIELPSKEDALKAIEKSSSVYLMIPQEIGWFSACFL